MQLRADNPALAQAITIHPRMVKSPTETTILKSVSTNKKVGKGGNIVAKGKWRGMPMFQMSLQERASCPRTCKQWAKCYGNNMAFAHRIDHTHPDFLSCLEAEIDLLCKRYSFGIVIRPHIIGDYYSPEYAAFWIEQTAKHRNLHIFGFTHWERDSIIGRMITEWNKNPKVWVRFSDQGGDMSANVAGGEFDDEGFTCPEQTGKTYNCLTCGACWTTTKAVKFLEH